jgi:acyl-CoA reductase-like NAD-dependent aldehyde dehydrogenase
MSRTTIAKTIKLFISGDFPRTESGRSFALKKHGTDEVFANICQASRKDLRNAVEAALKAQPGWQGKTAYNRSQILYRMAEMAEGKRAEFVEALTLTMGLSEQKAEQAVDEMIDAFVYYSGFADKYQSLMGSINPVAGPHHNFTAVEPVGVVSLVSEDECSLADFVAELCAIIVSGNAVVALLPQKGSALLAPLSEVLATSDLPGGVVNLLTGLVDELIPHMSSHMEINSISFQRKTCAHLPAVKEAGVENMKRFVAKTKNPLSLEHLLSFVEYKTVWHPAGY